MTDPVKPEAVVPPVTPATPPVAAPPVAPELAKQPDGSPSAIQPPSAPVTPPAAAAPGETITATKVTIGEDENIPTDAALLEMSPKALQSRIARATKTQLRERFGTDNPDDIKAKLDRLAEFEAKAEQDRLAALTETERLKEVAAKADAKAAEWERKYTEEVQSQLYEKGEGRVMAAATKHLDPDFIEPELKKFARHLTKTYSSAELEKLGDDVIEKYFVDRIAAKPKLGKDFVAPVVGAAAAPAGAAPIPVVPIRNGAIDQARPAPAGGVDPNVKAFRPGQSNSMTAQEAAAEARKHGYNWQ